jgi:DNA-directed RNA polymerase subunit RPC12/RpoP
MFNNKKIDIPCPNCGYKKPFKVKDLKKNIKYDCPRCRKTIDMDTTKFASGIKKAEKELDKLLKNFKI